MKEGGRNFGAAVYSGGMSNESGEISERQKPVVNKKLVAGAGGLAVAQLLNFGAPVVVAATENISAEDKMAGEVPSKLAFDNLNLVASNNVESPISNRQENEYKVIMDVAAQTVDGRTQVPVRFIAENMGCKVVWDGSKEIQTVTISKENTTVVMKKNKKDLVFSKVVTVNGVNKTIDVPGQIIGGRTCVPLRFLAENLGFGVDYDSPTKEITILEPKNTGKILVAKIGSKEVKVIQNTYEAGTRRAAYFADAVSRKDLLDSLKSPTGPIEPPTFIFDNKSGAQINYLNNKYNVKFQNDSEQQVDFTTRFGGKVSLSENNVCYNYADKLVIFKGVDKKHVSVFAVSSGRLETVNSTSDVNNIVVDPKNENNLIIKNLSNQTWVNGKWEAAPVVKTEAEKVLIQNALKFVAGGEFWGENIPYRVDVGKTGVVRIYPTESGDKNIENIFDKVSNEIEKADLKVVCYWNGYVCGVNDKSSLNYQNVGEKFDQRPSCVLINPNTKEIIKITDNVIRQKYFPEIRLDPVNGPEMTDGLRVTHYLDINKKRFEWLDTYKMLGTPTQRMDKLLDNYSKSYVVGGMLDAKEVAEYKKTRSDKNFKTFKILTDLNNDPQIIVLSDENNGLGERLTRIAKEKSNPRMNEISQAYGKDLIKYWGEQCGANCLTFGLNNFPLNPDNISGGSSAIYDRFYDKSKGLYLSGIVMENKKIRGSDWSEYGLSMDLLLTTFGLEAGGIKIDDYEEKVNGVWKLPSLKNKICNTDYGGVLKQAEQAHLIELLNRQKEETVFDGKTIIKYSLKSMENNLNPDGILTRDEYLTAWQEEVLGYNVYVQMVNK